MMEPLRLVRPDEDLLAECAAYKQEMLESGSSMDGCGSLPRHTPEEWLENCRRLSSEETCPEGWVPATQFVCLDSTGSVVGMIDLRHRLNDYLAEIGGNIGYSVRPSQRRKGYATAMLHMVLSEARRIGLARVLVTCDDDNEASRRVIERNGGLFERTAQDDGAVVRRYWIDL